MTTLSRGPRPRGPRLLLVASALGLALSGCAGTGEVADAPDEGLPTAEDLDAEHDGGAVTSGMCVEGEPDCEDMVVVPEGDAAAGSCLAGDEDCTDESFDGQDVTRPVRLAPALDEQEDVMPAERGATSGASGRSIEQGTLVDEDTVRLVVIGNPCMLVEDVLVEESPDEVRVLVLAGQDAAVEDCEDEGLWWSLDIDLDAPLGDRSLLDLAG